MTVASPAVSRATGSSPVYTATLPPGNAKAELEFPPVSGFLGRLGDAFTNVNDETGQFGCVNDFLVA
jgi:hypothetical protein